MALVGLIESLLTLNLVDDLTETTGQPNRESVGLGVANTLTGLFTVMTATEIPVIISNTGILPNKLSVHHSKVPITTINITPEC
jgi:MFS superfamily sulfate permease-like transporter